MAVLRIPTPKGVPTFTQRVLLEQREYVFDVRWNQREARFYLVLSDSADNPITACKMAIDTPLLGALVDARRPPGELLLIDTLSTGEPAGLNELGERCVLRYIELATLAQIAADPTFVDEILTGE